MNSIIFLGQKSSLLFSVEDQNWNSLIIQFRSKLEFINNSISSPDMDPPEYEMWLSKDQLVMSWILNSMEQNLAEIFNYSESAHDL